MDDLVNSVKAYLYERVSSPFLAAYIASILIWNYKLILTLFSNMQLQQKFDYISTVLYPETWLNNIWHAFGWPLVATMIFLFFYPIPSLIVYAVSRATHRAMVEIKILFETGEPISQEDAINLRSAAFQLRTEYEKKIASLTQEIEELKKVAESAFQEAEVACKKEKDALEQVIDKLQAEKDESDKIIEELRRQDTETNSGKLVDSETEIQILNYISSQGRGSVVTVEDLMTLMDENDLDIAEVSLEELIYRKLLSTASLPHGTSQLQYGYLLTDFGRQELAKYKLSQRENNPE